MLVVVSMVRALSALAVLVGAHAAAPPWYTRFGTSARRSWAVGGTGAVTNKLAWATPLNCSTYASPLLDDSDGSVFMVDSACGRGFNADGKERWSTPFLSSCYGTAQPTLVPGGVIQIGCTSCGLIAGAFASNGSIAWHSFTNAAAVGPTLLLQSNLTFIPLWDFSLPAISAGGASPFSWGLPYAPAGTLAQDSAGHVYALTPSLQSGNPLGTMLHAWDERSRTVLWTAALPSLDGESISAGIVVSEDEALVYWAATTMDSTDGKLSWVLHAASTSNGSVVWSAHSPPGTQCTGFATPAAGPRGALYSMWSESAPGSVAVIVAAFDGLSGEQRWRVVVGPADGTTTTFGVAVDAAGAVLAFASTVGVALNGTTGTRLFNFPLNTGAARFTSSPAVRGDGALFVASNTALLAFDGRPL